MSDNNAAIHDRLEADGSVVSVFIGFSLFFSVFLKARGVGL